MHLRAVSQLIPLPPSTKIKLKIAYIRFHSNLPGANELMVVDHFNLYTSGPYRPKQVSFKNEVGVRVNDFVFWLTLWLNFEHSWLTLSDYVTEVFHFDKVCEWSLIQQTKVCLHVLKMCYDVSANTPLSYPILLIRNIFFVIYSCQIQFLSTLLNLMGGTLETKRKLNDYLICCK